MTDWLPILIMFIVAVGFALASLGASYLLSPKKATPEKLAPYECGIFPEVEPSQRFPVKFYMVAMLYIVFDIETTGGNPEKNGITEICAIKYSPSGSTEKFYSLVNPARSIPPFVRRITGITNAMVKDAPLIKDIMPKFLDFETPKFFL